MAGQGRADPRPLSPHLQVWKWHWTMAGSIFHRVTGVGLYFFEKRLDVLTWSFNNLKKVLAVV